MADGGDYEAACAMAVSMLARSATLQTLFGVGSESEAADLIHRDASLEPSFPIARCYITEPVLTRQGSSTFLIAGTARIILEVTAEQLAVGSDLKDQEVAFGKLAGSIVADMKNLVDGPDQALMVSSFRTGPLERASKSSVEYWGVDIDMTFGAT